MIVDVHSHVFGDPPELSEDFLRQAARAYGPEVDFSTDLGEYRNAAPAGTRTIVFGGKARRSGLWVDNRTVAAYVAQDPGTLTGFLSVDPTQPGWQEDLRHGHQELGLRGIKLLPMYAGYSPADALLDPLWAYARDRKLPVVVHTGTTFLAQAPLEFATPRHLDDVAARYPEVRIVLAHLGHPYEHECIAVVRKHANVYADISALHYRPWRLFNSLMMAQEYRVWDRLLLGSDYPFTTVNATIDGLRWLAAPTRQPPAFALDADEIEAMIHRDGLELLGLG